MPPFIGHEFLENSIGQGFAVIGGGKGQQQIQENRERTTQPQDGHLVVLWSYNHHDKRGLKKCPYKWVTVIIEMEVTSLRKNGKG